MTTLVGSNGVQGLTAKSWDGAAYPHQDLVLLMGPAFGDQHSLSATLTRWGYRPLVATDAMSALRMLFHSHPSLILLDLSIPGMGGWDLCQRIRELTDIPVILLSDDGSEDAKVRGLQLGADDFVVKPVGSAELAARAAAVMRRYRALPSTQVDVYDDGRVTIDFLKHMAYVDGRPLQLRPTEYRLLVYLARNSGQAVTHDQIVERVWGEESESFESVKQYISSLRKKLGDDPAAPKLIQTVRGVGYRYERPPK